GSVQALDRVVDQRLMLGEQKKELLGTALQLAAEVQNLLAPWVSVMNERIAQWRRIAQDASVSSERRGAADREFEKSLAWFRALQSSEVLASSVSDLLQRAAAADNPNDHPVDLHQKPHRHGEAQGPPRLGVEEQ